MNISEFDWLNVARAQLDAAWRGDRFPHAILVHEDPGCGGEVLALWTAQRALCRAPTNSGPCGVCQDCKAVEADQHPDVARLGPTEESRQIRIDDVRALSAEFALTSHKGGYKVAIVAPADAMNVLSANALLKTLEEPSKNTVLVLITSQPSRLPATIRSRCLRLRVHAPDREATLAWLQARKPGDYRASAYVLGNAPLRLLAVDPNVVVETLDDTARSAEEISRGEGDPVGTAERWSRADIPLRLACLETWVADRVRAGLGVGRESAEVRGSTHLPPHVSHWNIRKLFELHDGVRELKAQVDTPLNKSVALERWLWRLAATTGSARG